MPEGKITNLPISELNFEAGAQELVSSERMKPYLGLDPRIETGE
jgi:hypothetical protein